MAEHLVDPSADVSSAGMAEEVETETETLHLHQVTINKIPHQRR
jgi:hypothetical protein